MKKIENSDDYTFLECGAYNERWHSMHMMPEETAQVHLDLKGKILQPMHWGTFNLALHSWYDPIVRVSKSDFLFIISRFPAEPFCFPRAIGKSKI
jgi:L-ascorbate metabolism protein UlaG (beta-lactamase superfamily)